MSWLTGWEYRFKITSDNTKVTNANNNLSFDLADAPAEFWNNVRSDGGDIRVTKSDGVTEVAREIDSFIPTENDDTFDTTDATTGTTTQCGQILYTLETIDLSGVKYKANATGTHRLRIGTSREDGSVYDSGNVEITSTGFYTFQISDVELDIGTQYYFTIDRPDAVVIREHTQHFGILWYSIGYTSGTSEFTGNLTIGFGLIGEVTKRGTVFFDSTGLSTAQDSEWYIYYGKADETEPAANSTYGSEKVWNEVHMGVWHKNIDTPSYTHDSTINDNHGEFDSLLPAPIVSKLGQAQDYSVDNDAKVLPDGTGLLTTDDFTFSAWVKLDALGTQDNSAFFSVADGEASDRAIMYLTTSLGTADDEIRFFLGGSEIFVGSNIRDGNWHHVALIRDGNNYSFYLDGVLDADGQDEGGMNNTNFIMGAAYTSGRSIDGVMDEFRITDVGRSIGWLETEYNNQDNNATFWTVGTVEEETEGVQVGAEAIINISAESDLVKSVNKDSEASISISAEGLGEKITGVSSEALIEIIAEALGEKSVNRDSQALIDIFAEGAKTKDTPVGSESTIVITAEGEVTTEELIQKGAEAVIDISAQAEAVKSINKDSEAVVTILAQAGATQVEEWCRTINLQLTDRETIKLALTDRETIKLQLNDC